MARAASIRTVTIAVIVFATAVAANAQVAVDDSYTAKSGSLLTVEAPGVLENDHDGGGEPPPPPTAVAVLESGVSFGILLLNGDGSFDYLSDIGFVGTDSFTYHYEDGAATSTTATVTLTVDGCEAGPGPTGWTCWVEQAYLTKAAELNLSTFVESFEDDLAWSTARFPDTEPSVVSRGVTWQSNFAGNGVSTGAGPARNGSWGFFSYPHGDTSGAPGDRIYDGFIGSAASPGSLLGVGGWIVASQIGSSVDLVIGYDGGGTTMPGFPNSNLGYDHQFFGFIDTAGFSDFEFVETNGTVNQPFFIFGDDFIFAVAGSDSTPPRVVEIGSWQEPADGVISEGEITDASISELEVRFSEPVQDPSGSADPDDVTNPDNYLLFSDGGDGFQTVDCAGGIAAGDDPIPVEVVQYLSGDPSETWLQVNGGLPLPDAAYRLLVCGTTSIVDWAGNALDGDGNGVGGDDFARNFEISSIAVPAVSINDVAIIEGDVGTTDAVFTLSLSSTSSSEISVHYATAPGTATSGVDFLPASGTAVFPAQTLTQTVTVHVVGDLEPEDDETYSVELSAPVNATIGDPTGQGTITDDDAWTWYVATDGNDANDCLTTATACQTITEAVSRAVAGDQLNVAHGVYSERVVLSTDLTLIGERPLATVIDGGSTGTVVTVAPAVTVVVSGFEIRGGGAGGIVTSGDLTLEDSWVHDNGDGSPASFGGVRNFGSALLDRVAVTGNTGDGVGGVENSGQMVVRNTTISGNAGGPGVVNLPGATASLEYTTITDNGAFGLEVGDPGSASLRGTIVAGHATANCTGAGVSLGYNLEDADTCGLQSTAGDLIGVDPVLAPLGRHGGPSPTHAVGLSSPVLDAAETSGMPTVDQRGVDRPLDGDLNGTVVADIGAFEAVPGAIFDDGFETGDTSAWN